MWLDPITVKVMVISAQKNQIQALLLPLLLSIFELLSSHSELDPLLPIPNRTVKRLSANDSADYPRESRTLLGALPEKALFTRAFSFLQLISN